MLSVGVLLVSASRDVLSLVANYYKQYIMLGVCPSVMKLERFVGDPPVWSRTGLPIPGLRPLLVVSVGGHWRATLRIAHMREFFCLSVSGGLLPQWTVQSRCCNKYSIAVALSSYLKPSTQLAQFIRLRKQMAACHAGLVIVIFYISKSILS